LNDLWKISIPQIKEINVNSLNNFGNEEIIEFAKHLNNFLRHNQRTADIISESELINEW
jgi:hypothetical protein